MSSNGRVARVGVVGTGAIAQVAHLPILARMRGVEAVAVSDADRGKAETIAQRFGISNVYDASDELWNDPDVDAVVICTPSHLHEEHVRAALEAGKYVFCEKPLALSSEGAERILETPGAAERLIVGMNQRFRPDAAAIRSFVAGGELGEVFYLRTGWLNRRLGRAKRSWRNRRETAGGGVLMDLGLQMLDLALWIQGYPEPERLVAHLHRDGDSEIEDAAVVLLRLQGGGIINLEVTWSLLAEQERQYLHLLGSQGSGSFPPLTVFKELDNGLANVTPQVPASRENPFTASYRQQLQYFAEVVRGEETPVAPTEQVLLMRVMEAAYHSAETGEEVWF